MSVTGTQVRQALDKLIGAKPKKAPLKIKTPPPVKSVDELEDEVLTLEDMEIAKAKKDAESMTDDDLLDMEEYTEMADTVDQAQEVFSTAKQVYGGPRIPKEAVVNEAALRAATGQGFDNLTHYSDNAITTLASIAVGKGKSPQYLTNMTADDAALVSQAFLKKSDMNLGNAAALRDDMLEYAHEGGFRSFPQLEATVNEYGDTIITGIDRTKGDDGRGWNTAMLLSGMSQDVNALKHLPLVLNYDKPVFEYAGRMSGNVFVRTGDGELKPLLGIKVESAPNRGLRVDNSSWADAPLDPVTVPQRVGMLFSNEAMMRGASVAAKGTPNDFRKLKKVMWSDKIGDLKFLKAAKSSVQSYFPKDDAGESFFDKWVPLASAARKQIKAYTKDSPYKARLIDPDAPPDAPMMLFRGAQGNQFINSSGELQTLKVMDPRNAREFAAHLGSLDQATYFAVRGIVENTDITSKGRSAFKDLYTEGNTILRNRILNDPKLTEDWGSFQDELVARTKWGNIVKPEGFDDEAMMLSRPTHNDLVAETFTLLMEPRYANLRKAFGARRNIDQWADGPGELSKDNNYIATVNKAMATLAKGNADLDVFVTNAKAPLFLWDTGNFNTRNIANQLLDRPDFQKHTKELQEIITVADEMHMRDQGFSNIANTRLRRVIEAEGYDHIAYTNLMEAPGTPSFIFWKKDSLRPLSDFGVDKEVTKLLAAPIFAVLAAAGSIEDGAKDKEGTTDERTD